jgi:hypothetical protein
MGLRETRRRLDLPLGGRVDDGAESHNDSPVCGGVTVAITFARRQDRLATPTIVGHLSASYDASGSVEIA